MLETFTGQQWKLLIKFVQDPSKYKNGSHFYTKAIEELESLNLDGRGIREKAAMYRSGISKIPLCKCGEKVAFSLSTYKWAKNCGQACYLRTIKQGAKPISVNGKVYPSLAEASKVHNSIYENLYDANNHNVFYISNHKETCLENLCKSNPLLVDEPWLKEQKKNNVSINELTSILGVSRETVNNAFLFFGIDRKFNQLPTEAIEMLNNEDLFKTEFEAHGSEVMATKYGCSPTTILIRARELGCKMGRTVSSIETELKTFIESFDIPVLQSDRTSISQELDLYVPSNKLAIELDGLFWHSEWDAVSSNKNRHKKKYQLCSDKNITLLRFTDYETTNKLGIVKSMIASKLGMSDTVYARKCVVKKLSGGETKKFFETNHLSGYSSSSVNLGLFYEDDLVMCMSFGKPRFNKKYSWEVVRMASKLNVNVVGGASKLLAYFRKNHLGSIISYSDNRTGSGNTYRQLGFDLIAETDPGYFYVKKNKVFSRFMFQKNKIQKLCPIYDSQKTEFENAISNGYGRYWDCGNKIWVLQ
jgi:hypothetical protein